MGEQGSIETLIRSNAHGEEAREASKPVAKCMARRGPKGRLGGRVLTFRAT